VIESITAALDILHITFKFFTSEIQKSHMITRLAFLTQALAIYGNIRVLNHWNNPNSLQQHKAAAHQL